MIVYDPRGQTWESWCGLVAELFAQQQLGVVPEARWQEWADGLSGVGYFSNSGVPDSRGFASWQDWAAAFVGAMTVEMA